MAKHPIPLQQRQRKARTAVAERRVKVMQLRLAGYTSYEQIAAVLKVTPMTITRDMQAIDMDYRVIAAQDRETEKGRDLARIDAMIKPIWQDAAAGNIKCQDMVLKWLRRRAAILGYDAVERTELVGAGGGPIQVERTEFRELSSQERFNMYQVIEAEIVADE